MARKGSNVYSQPESRASSSIYGSDPQGLADDIADRSLRGEIVNESDGFGQVPSTMFGTDVIEKNSGSTGKPDKAKTHKGDVAGGSDDVTNEHAAHERRSLKDTSPTHAERSYRDEDNKSRPSQSSSSDGPVLD
jgi:hypothetical protein